MQTRVEALDAGKMDWAETPAPGLFVKMLRSDEATGAHTALYCLAPKDGYQAPQTAHYHHTFEEIVPVSGCFSFDQRTWLELGAYVYHPPLTVHGFNSAVRSEAVFLTRVGASLDFNFVPEPAADDIYLVEDVKQTRHPLVVADAEQAQGSSPKPFLGADARITALGKDSVSGEASAFVHVPSGWKSGVAQLSGGYLEVFVLKGGLCVDGQAMPGHSYFYYPSGAALPELSSRDGAMLFVAGGAELEL